MRLSPDPNVKRLIVIQPLLYVTAKLDVRRIDLHAGLQRQFLGLYLPDTAQQ